MSIIGLLIIAVGLSMDAMAVAICKGLSLGSMSLKNAVLVGIWFGGFQAMMPLAGYLLGAQFEDRIVAFDHWAAFILLGMIGVNMVREGCSCEEEKTGPSLSARSMLPLAVATSIDALAVGVTFAFLQAAILPAVMIIGMTTFILSMVGVKLGTLFGAHYKSKAEITGGIILILMGTKILIEHLTR